MEDKYDWRWRERCFPCDTAKWGELNMKDTILEIDGLLDVTVEHEEFLNEFYEWLDSKGWTFLGVTKELEDEEV